MAGLCLIKFDSTSPLHLHLFFFFSSSSLLLFFLLHLPSSSLLLSSSFYLSLLNFFCFDLQIITFSVFSSTSGKPSQQSILCLVRPYELVSAMMFFLFHLALFCLARIVRGQKDLGCGTTSPASTIVKPSTVASCTLFYTPALPPQIGPISTVYATMMTTRFNIGNCGFCKISNVAQNPVPTVDAEETVPVAFVS